MSCVSGSNLQSYWRHNLVYKQPDTIFDHGSDDDDEGATSPTPSAQVVEPFPAKPGNDWIVEQGVVVQSNFKIYAYTASQLVISLLGLFCDMEIRLPNLVVGQISRSSCLKAFQQNITAAQILRFLTTQVNPDACKTSKEEPLPENVATEILLWEQERQRVTVERVQVLSDWNRYDLFKRTVTFAEQWNYLLWSTPIANAAPEDLSTLKLVVKDSDDGVHKIRMFINSLKTS
eukprot:GHVL01044662.1.p2 GENE.GHVL01044662.1~~GHVL01044662.1.p2  ORF type:complete len:232 (+),score=33.69 GHVL01044662.1:986-1681(+)